MCNFCTCSNYSIQETTEELQNDNIDIWHISSNAIELCTTLSNDELKKHYNLHCHVNKRLKDLLKLEDVEDYSLTRFVNIYFVILPLEFY